MDMLTTGYFVIEAENKMLPPMHGMDNYRECKRNSGQYCKFTFKIIPGNMDGLAWQIIQVSIWT